MKQEYEETQFVRAAQSFAAVLPKRVEATDEDLAKIVIPGWRYDEIADAVLKMYEKADAHVMPLPVFDIANALGYATIPYRAYGARFLEVFLATSEDAFTMQFRGSAHPVISSFSDSAGTENLMSQIATSSWGGLRKCPYAFTEQGIAMLSAVLRSKTAIAKI